MALFQMKWLRRWVRRNTNPIPEDSAELWKRRLSVAYALLAWNAFGFVCYMAYTGRSDWAKYYGYKSEEEAKLSPAQQFATKLNVDRGKIVRYSGFTRVGEVEFDNKSDKVE
ncbi:uncharacterized protein LOC118748900 [Rhagoletis pomonella]|uniref:uncharacterized protein LOC118748900 n=1 Tax=Rhagoletis pomonella TaxID=28610 RepID=UPI00177C0E2F|nr:uncharacterized protein LOC118748900 [Rhagoletis pomonella]